jgi:serine/threonine protein kinase
LNGKRERPPVLPEPIQRILFRQIVNAVSALHSNNIVHRDLKDENFLVDRNLRVHLIDFGHAGRCYQDRFHFAPTRFSSYGTHLFGPPEWRSGRMLAGPQADVYAIGLILYEMSFGDLPPNLEKARAEQNNCVFDISARTGFHSPILRQLLYGMLSPDPNKRLTIEKVQQHPWLTEEV